MGRAKSETIKDIVKKILWHFALCLFYFFLSGSFEDMSIFHVFQRSFDGSYENRAK